VNRNVIAVAPLRESRPPFPTSGRPDANQRPYDNNSDSEAAGLRLPAHRGDRPPSALSRDVLAVRPARMADLVTQGRVRGVRVSAEY